MNLKWLFLCFLLLGIGARAQDKTALQYAERLDSVRMKITLSKLASNEFAGRKSDGEGAQLTVNYLIEQLKLNHLKEGNQGSYKQNIEAFKKLKSNKYFKLADFNYAECYSYSNSAFQDSVLSGSDLVFAGFGIYDATYNDFSNLNIKDKIVMIVNGDGPINKYGVRCHNANAVPNMNYITSQHPKAILMVRRGFNTFSNYASDRLNFYSKQEDHSVIQIQINELLANRILDPVNKSIKQFLYETESSCTSAPFEFKNELAFNGDFNYQLADANNIMAVIEGSDLKTEYVFLTAHYDHMGKNYDGATYAGADDNASGVSVVMEIARVLNEAKKAGKGPRRTVVVLFPTAEEDGLCGSDYYLQKPTYPLDKTVACVNVDMLGRMGSEVDTKQIETGYVYALTGTNEVNNSLYGIPDSINAICTKLSMISKDGSSYDGFYSRSDHYNFYKKKIPSIMFTNGSHKDLHRTTDTEEKINYTAMLNRSKLVFLTVWDLANSTHPFKKPQVEIESSEAEFEISK